MDKPVDIRAYRELAALSRAHDTMYEVRKRLDLVVAILHDIDTDRNSTAPIELLCNPDIEAACRAVHLARTKVKSACVSISSSIVDRTDI